MHTSLLLWIVLFPLLGALWNGISLLSGRTSSRLSPGRLGMYTCFASFVFSVWACWFLYIQKDPLASLHWPLWTWIHAGNLHLDLHLTVDPLSAVLLLLVSGIGLLVHIYSLGYMQESTTHGRYFSYLNLLVSLMCVLIMADNLVVLLLGWQGIGMVSALLISFSFQDTEKAKAGVTSWIVYRVGDLCLVLGMMVLFWTLYPHLQAGESLTFATIGKYIDVLKETRWLGMASIEIVGLCLWIGALAKSGLIPLQIWPNDAVVCPVPASALIYTTTVIASVYMLARLNFLYSAAPIASSWIALLGSISACYAACVALFQNDIRKILVHISLSQVSLMFVGVGIGAYTAGIFHLITYTLFVPLLFFCAGSIITSMRGECDIRNMGGLFRHIGITGVLFLIGAVSVIGFPGFSGFFSKDKILWKTFATQHQGIWLLCMLSSTIVAIAMTRLFCLVFLGESRTAPQATQMQLRMVSPESQMTMLIPTIALALSSALASFLGLPHFLTGKHPVLEHWLAPVFAKGWLLYHPQGAELMGHIHQHPHLPWGEGIGMIIATLGILVGIGVALFFYAGNHRTHRAIHAEWTWQDAGSGSWKGWCYRLFYHQFYVREVYEKLLVRPILHLSRDGLWPFDQVVIDGMVRWLAQCIQTPGRWSHDDPTKDTYRHIAMPLWISFTLLLWLLITYVLP